MPPTEQQLLSARQWVEGYIMREGIRINRQVFSQFVITVLRRSATESGLTILVADILGDRAQQFSKELFAFLQQNATPPAASQTLTHSPKLEPPQKQAGNVSSSTAPQTVLNQRKDSLHKARMPSPKKREEPFPKKREERDWTSTKRSDSNQRQRRRDYPRDYDYRHPRRYSHQRRRHDYYYYSDYESSDEERRVMISKATRPIRSPPERTTRPIIPPSERYIIYVCGLEPNQNTVTRLAKEFAGYGAVKAVQVMRSDRFALVEFFELRAAFNATRSSRCPFNNPLIKVGFASDVDPSEIEAMERNDNLLERKRMETQAFILEDNSESSYEYDQELREN